MSSEESIDKSPEVELEEDQVEISSQEETPEGADQAEPASTDLAQKVEALEDALANAKDQAMRAAAEAQNARRRAEQDVEKAHKFALDKFVNDLLPVVDNLERAIDASNVEGAEANSLSEGVELTLKALVDALAKHKVEAIFPEGEPFDPQFHQAMSMIESPDVEPNTVLNVFQKGYSLNGRLVRPAMVVVSKAGSE